MLFFFLDPCSPLARLQSLQHEYKLAALRAKHQDDTATATRHLRIAKSFDPVLEALSRGELVDLSRLPPPPGEDLIPCPSYSYCSLGAAHDNQASPSLSCTLSPDQLSPEPPLPAAQPLTPASTLTRPGRLL